MSKSKRLLITGSAGFVYSSAVRQIIYQKYPYKISSVDRISNNTLNNVYSNKNHQFYIGDLTDEHFLDIIFQIEKPEIIVHGAAATAVDASLNNPMQYVKDNVTATQSLICAAVKYGVERFVLASTDEVLGQLTSEFDESWTEESKINPRNPYSATKASSELLLLAANKSYNIPYNILRTSNMYGVRQTTDKLIPKVIKCILNNEKIPIFGQGQQIRDWTYVQDHCLALMKILECGSINEIYNISANCEISNIELVNKICNIIGKGHDLISFIPDPRKSHDFRYSLNTNKIRSLGWSPQTSFKDGLKLTVDWYLNNQWFLK